MTALTDLLDAAHPSGVVRGPAAAAARLRAAGWRVATVRATTKSEFLAACATALRLPDYFGHNLDALLDCLRDLDEPVALAWTGWDRLRAGHAHDWAAIRGVLEQRAAERPGFAVLLVE